MMARKNRYEYSILKETYRFLYTTTWTSYEKRDQAQRLMNLIADFLDEEHIELSPVTPPLRSTLPIYETDWGRSATSYVSPTSLGSGFLNQISTAELRQCEPVPEVAPESRQNTEESPF